MLFKAGEADPPKQRIYLAEAPNIAQYDFPQCIKLPAPKKRPKMAALPSVVCPICLIFKSPGTCILMIYLHSHHIGYKMITITKTLIIKTIKEDEELKDITVAGHFN